MITLAWGSVSNQCSFKHSSRSFQRRPICIALIRPVFTRSQAVQ
ncbi:hypothetical protein [Aquabacterium humicola]|nr:hypothetical protein [Rubrivivax pictus]